MKKVTILAAAVALLGVSAVEAHAQAATQQEQATQKVQADKKEKVTHDQLPEPVKVALKSDTYKDWAVVEIFKLPPVEGAADGVVVYEVTMANAQGQKGSILLDEKGADASKKE
ncbi:hypothetical protein ACFSRY_05295 [Pontibacter locisalis]|uniref:Peptidase propeptide and YPEB domain-containing protein n=1 Tax=Pontibacter locisalis TaxID=1719035 RepID=A0ABW5IK13_9BACT